MQARSTVLCVRWRKSRLQGRKDSLNLWFLVAVLSFCGFPIPPPWKVVKIGAQGEQPRARHTK